MAMHCSWVGKIFTYTTTNVTHFLYMVVLKIAIKLFSTTNTNALMPYECCVVELEWEETCFGLEDCEHSPFS